MTKAKSIFSVHSRYNPAPLVRSNIVRKHLTEQGLVIPLAKLVERFTKGQEVPHLYGSILSSVPFKNKFDSDLISKYKDFNILNSNLKQIQDSINSTPSPSPSA